MMPWKRFGIIFINTLFLCFPYNILGCAGGEPDPYDYYIGFFHNNLSESKQYKSFYYSNCVFLYNEDIPHTVADTTAAEWINYTRTKANKNQAYDFICHFSLHDIALLKKQINGTAEPSLPDSLRQHPFTQYFLKQRDVEALDYLLYAKKAEPHVTKYWDGWSEIANDSLQMNTLINEGIKGYQAAISSFIQLRYAYQVCRLYRYNNRFKECIEWNDQFIQPNTTNSILKELGNALKAGAHFKTGNNELAAYEFSQCFFKNEVHKISNYISFDWAAKRGDALFRKHCMAYCKNDEEKAKLLALFSLGSNAPEMEVLHQIYTWAPNADVLPVLVTREINKIEEFYFSPTLQQQKLGVAFFENYYYNPDNNTAWETEANQLQLFCNKLLKDASVKEKGFYGVAAAQLSLITKDYSSCKNYLIASRPFVREQALSDQWKLTSLILTINSRDSIDTEFENDLLTPIQWLEQKALTEDKDTLNYWKEAPWTRFYRNMMQQILSRRYLQQGNVMKAVLCMGKADQISGGSYNTEWFVQNSMETKDVMALSKIIATKGATPWEKYITNGFPVPADKVTEVIAMSYVRDYDFDKAIGWWTKIKDSTLQHLDRNPFGELLADNQHHLYAFDKGTYTKLQFLRALKSLNDKIKTNKASAAEMYKMAIGYYNLTYYGRAWEMVKHYRSGSDGYFIPENALPFEKEYYGAYTAEKMFKKAMIASSDKNFKAKCLFMMAKCHQKTVQQPQYHQFNNQWDAYSKAEQQYFKDFMRNPYFSTLVKDYGTTPFYKQAFNSCSYLRDFVRKN